MWIRYLQSSGCVLQGGAESSGDSSWVGSNNNKRCLLIKKNLFGPLEPEIEKSKHTYLYTYIHLPPRTEINKIYITFVNSCIFSALGFIC